MECGLQCPRRTGAPDRLWSPIRPTLTGRPRDIHPHRESDGIAEALVITHPCRVLIPLLALEGSECKPEAGKSVDNPVTFTSANRPIAVRLQRNNDGLRSTMEV